MIGLDDLAFLLPLGVVAGNTAHPGRTPEQESLRDIFRRIEHELLWPRILVRYAPPQDDDRPNAPDRFARNAGRRPFFR